MPYECNRFSFVVPMDISLQGGFEGLTHASPHIALMQIVSFTLTGIKFKGEQEKFLTLHPRTPLPAGALVKNLNVKVQRTLCFFILKAHSNDMCTVLF